MRILLASHHYLNPNAGAPGATLALGAALAEMGHEVEYFAYDHAFPGGTGETPRKMLAFPWRLARYLAAHTRGFDVVDAQTGNNWVWALRGRPGAPKRNALTTRSHGLEHTLEVMNQAAAQKNGIALDWKYRVYQAGYRLWEVRRSMQAADRVFLLNEGDKDYAVEHLGIAAERISVVPNGMKPELLGRPAPEPHTGPIRLAWVGSWLPRKAPDVFMEAVQRLAQRGVAFEATVAGAGEEAAGAIADLPPAVRARVHEVPRFQNTDLPKVLADHDLFVFPTRFEGFSLALIEAMACGLAPIATPVGGAASVIQSGENGVLVPVDDVEAMTAAIARLAADPAALLQMRRAAHASAQQYRWSAIAARTVDLYEAAMTRAG